MSKSDERAWEDIGVVDVDSGHLWFGDPCYVLDPATSRPKELGKEWDDLIPHMISADAVQWHFDGGTPGLGVTVSSGYGDGRYVVRIKRGADGCVRAAMIEFIGDDEV